MQLKEFKIRCSAIGDIMGNTGLTDNQESRRQDLIKRSLDALSGKAKPLTEKMKDELDKLDRAAQYPELTQTCKSYLNQWIKEQIYGTEKEIKSKYLTKGIYIEHESIDYYSEHKGLGFVLKNEDYFSGDFIHGTPDLITKDTVIDIKSSWDCFTFPLFDDKVDKKYFAQLQGYMHITGKKKAVLAYVLMNTPDELEWDEPVDYKGLDPKFRIKEFEFEFDPEFIESVEKRVLECREYINQVTKDL